MKNKKLDKIICESAISAMVSVNIMWILFITELMLYGRSFGYSLFIIVPAVVMVGELTIKFFKK